MRATVVVSTYNQEKYIVECLESILSQESDYQFNIIVSDDNSKDKTPIILKEYSYKYPDRISLILRDKNVGAAANYVGVHNEADGDIIFHMDGDDVMLPSKIQKQMQMFSVDSEVNIIFHRALYFSDDGSLLKPTKGFMAGQEIVSFSAREMAMWGSIAVHSSYAYRRSSRKVHDIGREFMEWFFAMDSLLPDGKGLFINDVLVKYRINQNGNSYLSTGKGKMKAYRIYFQDIYHYFGLNPDLRPQLFANAVVSFLGMLKNVHTIDLSLFKFLLRNIFYFNPSYIKSAYTARLSNGLVDKENE
ncbi:glycosyltransferase [Pseudobdellovibrio exovorus]|uniref:Glycosyltransferase 2-like domain-containing protein n=1 Tax=Pseudobdellovibrio exovorus JSS TaxID=1184267 RepID=M4V8G3_9BACT|nr:glycosyltransferase [Pseudobdellovibrio exovorus]AGH95687.1 hypothetical protein A11Q_1471 [Pseudobdellovibrio exovorus JSS]